MEVFRKKNKIKMKLKKNKNNKEIIIFRKKKTLMMSLLDFLLFFSSRTYRSVVGISRGLAVVS